MLRGPRRKAIPKLLALASLVAVVLGTSCVGEGVAAFHVYQLTDRTPDAISLPESIRFADVWFVRPPPPKSVWSTRPGPTLCPSLITYQADLSTARATLDNPWGAAFPPEIAFALDSGAQLRLVLHYIYHRPLVRGRISVDQAAELSRQVREFEGRLLRASDDVATTLNRGQAPPHLRDAELIKSTGSLQKPDCARLGVKPEIRSR